MIVIKAGISILHFFSIDITSSLSNRSNSISVKSHSSTELTGLLHSYPGDNNNNTGPSIFVMIFLLFDNISSLHSSPFSSSPSSLS